MRTEERIDKIYSEDKIYLLTMEDFAHVLLENFEEEEQEKILDNFEQKFPDHKSLADYVHNKLEIDYTDILESFIRSRFLLDY